MRERDDLLAKPPPTIVVSFDDDGAHFTDQHGQRVQLVADKTAVMTMFTGGSFHVHRRVQQQAATEIEQLG